MRHDDWFRLMRLVDGATDPDFFDEDEAGVAALKQIAYGIGALVFIRVLEDEELRETWEGL